MSQRPISWRGHPMEFRQFGRADLRVSAIGFGWWEIGGTYGRLDDATFSAAAQAIDSSVACFDSDETPMLSSAGTAASSSRPAGWKIDRTARSSRAGGKT